MGDTPATNAAIFIHRGYNRRRKEHGGLKTDQVNCFNELEREIAHLEKAGSDN